MKGVWHLAWRYLCFHKYKTLVLVASIGLIVFIPTGLNVLVKKGSEQLTARAEQTPLMLGRVGSPLELVLNGLYFQSDTPPPLNFGDYLAIKDMDMGQVIPLHTGFRSRGFPIIGTRLSNVLSAPRLTASVPAIALHPALYPAPSAECAR